ncbi:MAG TPA: polysaccharide deacetylase family protein [Vicinamibacterales bacterium]|nr:polysaccharide deacetylase family protein [Vicinamibacterales bacterium]
MRQLIGRLRRRLRPAPVRPAILMYHRVASPRVDPWGLAVSPQNFAAHLRVIRGCRTPMTMSALVERLQRRTLPDNAVAVTFDDGYVDNLRQARPLLLDAGVPATLFVTTGATGRTTEFWWDEIARGILAREAALDCAIRIAGQPCVIAFDRSDRERLDRERCWRAWQDPRTSRQKAYMDVWSRLRAASPDARDAAMLSIGEALDDAPADPDDVPMSASELAQMTAGGVVEIGAHTVSHPVLPLLDAAAKRHETGESKRACERIAGAPVAGFAYPHGAMNEDARAAVQEAGFRWACSTAHQCVPRTNPDLFALPRLFIEDWDASSFERALRHASARAAAAEESDRPRQRDRVEVTS